MRARGWEAKNENKRGSQEEHVFFEEKIVPYKSITNASGRVVLHLTMANDSPTEVAAKQSVACLLVHNFSVDLSDCVISHLPFPRAANLVFERK